MRPIHRSLSKNSIGASDHSVSASVRYLMRACSWSWPSPNVSAQIFFFQAEDGIRDKLVTGVQTCALPISPPTKPAFMTYTPSLRTLAWAVALALQDDGLRERLYTDMRASRVHEHKLELKSYRSEESRVGKECRSRWSPER